MLGLLPLLSARRLLNRTSTCAQELLSPVSSPVQRLALRALCQQADALLGFADCELINGERLFGSSQVENVQARISAATSVAAPGERCLWVL